ncbi:hypothetical protein PybrP1_005914 [[Pythium] brassicae (nom. inval.)]|nr:hypothetical protein PybrP1_005914 [[Pythium] brassicae (nom. inval.)]
MVVKGLNTRGVAEFCRALVLRPHLLLPQLSVRDLNDVSFQALKDHGFQGVVFDKDNTLTVPHRHEMAPHLQSSLDECRRVFGDRVLIFSNSAGSSDDCGFTQAAEIEAQLRIAVLTHNEKKPGGIEHVEAHFGVDPATLVMIGDRYSTDMLFGNLHGLLTIRTDQFTREGESAVNAQLQRVEKAVVRLLERAGVTALVHPLLPDARAVTKCDDHEVVA